MEDAGVSGLEELPAEEEQSAEAAGSILIGGLIAPPRVLSFAEVGDLDKVRTTENFRCTMGRIEPSVEWEGVSVADILRHANIETANAKWLLFGSGDYTAVMEIGKAMRGSTIIALKRSGRGMTKGTGGPFRLVFEGHRGYDSVKSVDRIELLDRPAEGTAKCASQAST